MPIHSQGKFSIWGNSRFCVRRPKFLGSKRLKSALCGILFRFLATCALADKMPPIRKRKAHLKMPGMFRAAGS